jgi:hypothetical protein
MMPKMRTTVTLDPDVEALVKRAMRERGISFKDAVNGAIRGGLGGSPAPFKTPARRMGFDPSVPLDKALRLAGDLEDEQLRRRL